MRPPSPRAGAGPEAAPRDRALPPVWPNGSGVFARGPDGRTELGRVVRDGEGWRIWRRTGGGYRSNGTEPTQSAAILSLLACAIMPGPLSRMSGRKPAPRGK